MKGFMVLHEGEAVLAHKSFTYKKDELGLGNMIPGINCLFIRHNRTIL
jgi:hypothetical protein